MKENRRTIGGIVGGVGGFIIFGILGAILGGIIGFIIGFIIETKEYNARLYEQEMSDFIESLYKDWDDALSSSAVRIRDNVNNFNKDFDYNKEYNVIKSYYRNYPKYKNHIGVLTEIESSQRYRYDDRYNVVKQWLINELDTIINNNLTKSTSPYNCKVAVLALQVLKIVYDNDENLDKAINAMSDFKDVLYGDTVYISFLNYGEAKLPLDEVGKMEYYDSNIDSIFQSIKERYDNAAKNSDEYYTNYINNLTVELLSDVGSVLWYYAKKKPFDINKFNEAKVLYNKYLSFNGNNSELTVKLEVILATIYAKNQMGGENLVRQDWEYINKWLESKYNNDWTKTCCLLASGLAWMELYNLERDILRKLVQLGCNLDETMQDRLNFLESGGTGNINVYNVSDNNNFYFDNSSIDWKQKEIDIFFRKVSMKNIELQYSLCFDSWTKTLPLAKGQKVSNDDIYKEFMDMTKDFDGEIKCRRTIAKAVNLENLEYQDAFIFDFDSKRNKCLSMLFSSEKYGRNLNLTILTLFTPEAGLSNEEMKKYAIAITNNIYVDSFRESILQCIDTILREKKTVYDEYEDEFSVNKKFIE